MEDISKGRGFNGAVPVNTLLPLLSATVAIYVAV